MASHKNSERQEAEGREGQTAAEAGSSGSASPDDTSGAADQVTGDERPDAAKANETTPEAVIEQLESQLAELEDRHLRLAAEYDNFRKRTLRERAQQGERAQAELVKALLESLDDLTRVSDLGSSEHEAASIIEGVRLVESKLQRALEAFGLKRIEAAGRRFDPELHDAMVTVQTNRAEEDEMVSQELATGYLFRDTLLRPSLVEVKKYEPGQGDEDPGDQGGES